MFEISVQSHFSAAHHLVGHPGKCAAVHGHNWEAEVFIRGEKLKPSGMLEDFAQVKDAVRDALSVLDHTDLNGLPEFSTDNPTSERIAMWLFRRLGKALNGESYRVHRVCVKESPGTTACYWE